MTAPLTSTISGPTVLLFGSQALSFNESSFLQLRLTLLDTPSHRWVLDTIAELPNHWAALCNAFPRLHVITGEKMLKDLNDWLRMTEIPQTDFPLPNILLTPLVVITQLTQYLKYIERGELDSAMENDNYLSFTQNAETLGFCTGLLSAFAVSSSRNLAQFQQFGAVAIRLAMFVGALVDAQDKASSLHSDWLSFSVTWNSAESRDEMTKIMKNFPEVRIPFVIDYFRIIRS